MLSMNFSNAERIKSLGTQRIEPGAAECEARTLSLVLCGPPFAATLAQSLYDGAADAAAPDAIKALFSFARLTNEI